MQSLNKLFIFFTFFVSNEVISKFSKFLHPENILFISVTKEVSKFNKFNLFNFEQL